VRDTSSKVVEVAGWSSVVVSGAEDDCPTEAGDVLTPPPAEGVCSPAVVCSADEAEVVRGAGVPAPCVVSGSCSAEVVSGGDVVCSAEDETPGCSAEGLEIRLSRRGAEVHGLRIQFGFRVHGLGFKVEGSGYRFCVGLVNRVQGSMLRG